MIKGFFFDLDGTLVDTHEANFQAYKRALADFDIDINFDDFKKTIGQQANDFLPQLAPSLDPEKYGELAERKAGYYKDVLHVSKRNHGLVEFLKNMGGSHKIVLVTTAKRRNAEAVLAHHELTTYFDHIVAAEDVARSKPSPEGYEKALALTGLQPNEAIAFEDSETGQQAAEAAKIAVVLIKDFAL